MNIPFIVIFFLVIIHPANAHLHGDEASTKVFNYKSAESIEPYQAVIHDEAYNACGGYLRAGFIQTQHQINNTTLASAVSAELGCGYVINPYIKAHLGLFGVLDTGFNSHNDENIHADFFNAKKDNYLLLGEAVLTLSYKNFEAHIGRQNFDSPHLDSDDLRMVSNLFEGYLIDYHFNDELYFGAGFIREASGWENGGNLSHFISIGEALGGQKQGAWLSWLSYEKQNINSNLWFYSIPEHLVMAYSELIYSDDITPDIAYVIGLQFDWGKNQGLSQLGQIDAKTIGIMASISAYHFTLTSAFNKNFGQSEALSSVGGGAFFTSMEDQTLDAVIGGNSQSALISLEYTLNSQLDIGIAIAEFSANNSKSYRKEEIDYFIHYSFNNQLTAELMYALTNDRHLIENNHQIRAIITYRY